MEGALPIVLLPSPCPASAGAQGVRRIPGKGSRGDGSGRGLAMQSVLIAKALFLNDGIACSCKMIPQVQIFEIFLKSIEKVERGKREMLK